MRHPWAALLLAGATPIAADWTVAIKTSGGFAGSGRGSIVASADGKALLRPPSRVGQPADACEGRLSEPELRRIAAAVKAARPEGWKQAGLKGAAPDAFGYVLELRQGESVQEVAWYDNTAERRPADLKELDAGVTAAWNRLRTGCGAGSLSRGQGSTVTRKAS